MPPLMLSPLRWRTRDDKVYNIYQEHQSIHIAHRAVLRVDDVVEELPDG